jgi:hypothetical protein
MPGKPAASRRDLFRQPSAKHPRDKAPIVAGVIDVTVARPLQQ